MGKRKKGLKNLGKNINTMSDSDNPTFDRESGEGSNEFPAMYKAIEEHNKRVRDKKKKKEDKKSSWFSKIKSKVGLDSEG